jgi:hypothetical protein
MFEIQVLVRDRHGQAHNGGKIKPINSNIHEICEHLF